MDKAKLAKRCWNEIEDLLNTFGVVDIDDDDCHHIDTTLISAELDRAITNVIEDYLNKVEN